MSKIRFQRPQGTYASSCSWTQQRGITDMMTYFYLITRIGGFEFPFDAFDTTSIYDDGNSMSSLCDQLGQRCFIVFNSISLLYHTFDHAPSLCQPAHTTFFTDASQPKHSSFSLRSGDSRCQTCIHTSLNQSTSMNSNSVSAYSFRNIQECNIQNSSISSISRRR